MKLIKFSTMMFVGNHKNQNCKFPVEILNQNQLNKEFYSVRACCAENALFTPEWVNTKNLIAL